MSILFGVVLALTLVGCNATVLEERYEYSVLASVEVIEVPQSTHWKNPGRRSKYGIFRTTQRLP